MTRPFVLGTAASLSLLALASCGQSARQAQSDSTTSTTATTSITSTKPTETTVVQEGSIPDPPFPLNANPLVGAPQVKSWPDLVAAAESAATAQGVRVALVDPMSALGSNPSLFFNGLAAAFIGSDVRVVESVGASGGAYLDQLVARVNATTPHLRASRITDATIDCALLPTETVDSLFCGVEGTSVEVEVPHASNSADSVADIARQIMPKVTMLNPTGHDHP
jgi:hypothetical protein